MGGGRKSPLRASARRHLPAPGAFTLVEMLVAIAIIVLLAGFLLVAVSRVFRQGSNTRAAADLAGIASALEAYKQDFGDYPRVTGVNTGAAVLAKALIGPSPEVKTSDWKQGQFRTDGTPPNQFSYIALVDNPSGTPSPIVQPQADWAVIGPNDGTGLRETGIRVGPNTIDDNDDGIPDRPGGKVWGPYLQPDKYLTRPDIGILLDSAGNPILYFSASTAKPDISQGQNYAWTGGRPLYDLQQNIRLFMRAGETDTVNARKRAQALLGDMNFDGAITRTPFAESGVSEAYLLWTAGPDGAFGPPIGGPTPTRDELHGTANTADTAKHNAEAAKRNDDVTNFR